jgi:uncharacterized protein YndB with AHSA1/START domain
VTDRIVEHSKQTTLIRKDIAVVFDAITSPSVWDAFFTTGMELDLRVGGEMIWRWKDWGPEKYSVEVPATVLSVEPPLLFSFEWGSNQKSTVTFRLTEKDGNTVVVCTEQGYPNTESGRAMALECASGWGEAVTLLKFYLEHGVTY